MAISKRGDKYRVFCYSAAAGRKLYVGQRDKISDARQLFREKTGEFKQGTVTQPSGMTFREYAEHWLQRRHGPGTRRTAPRTLTHNETTLRAFLQEFGDLPVDGGIDRGTALTWSAPRPSAAQVVSAMLNDAVNEQKAMVNPFANRQQPSGHGRQHIVPLTELEVDELAQLGLAMWGDRGYGLVCRAWIMCGAWTGARPGEYFGLKWPDLDLDGGLMTVRRVKGHKQTETIALPDPAVQAIRRIPGARDGLVFPTATGRPMQRGASRYYWDPVRKAFAEKLTPARRAELLDGRLDVDLYECRHFAASLMADRGASEFDIAHQLGNSPEVCRRVYIHTHRDRTNDRVRSILNHPAVADLDVARRRRSA